MDETASTQVLDVPTDPQGFSLPQSKFKKGDRVQFECYSKGKVLGHFIRSVCSRPSVVLIVLLDQEYRVSRWRPIEKWIETDNIRLIDE